MLSGGAHEVKAAFQTMCVINVELKTRRVKYEFLLQKWRNLNRKHPSVLDTNGKIRPEIAAMLGEEEARKISGSEMTKEERVKKTMGITHRIHTLVQEQERLNFDFITAVRKLYEVIDKHKEEFPDLWVAFGNFRSAGGVSNHVAGNVFLAAMDTWMKRYKDKL